jgi:glutamate-1-semialdehyde aminotransferase
MKSADLLRRALERIPGGGQTDTKTIDHRLVGIQPSFFVRGKGVYTQDPDGAWWLDCQMGLAAYVLGYSDAKVNDYVREQLKDGSLFSLASTIELEVAEILLGIFPEFEMVRFAKNGSDVTSAAIRIARRYTGRDYVIGCGYHGFQDWSMSLRNSITGIPERIRDLTHGQEEVDPAQALAQLNAQPQKYAAVIIDTGGYGVPDLSVLKQLRDKCHQSGTVFIMDEVVSGFRVSLRGTLGYSSIIPDMICLGKAVANGFPLSVLMGSKSLLSLAPETGMSSTFGGDCVALAAAKATLEQLKDGSVNVAIDARGAELIKVIDASIERNGLAERLRVVGYPALFDLTPFKNDPDKKRIVDYLMCALAKRHIFWQESFVLCRDFGAHEAEVVAAALEEAFSDLSLLIQQDRLKEEHQSILRQQELYLEGLTKESIL